MKNESLISTKDILHIVTDALHSKIGERLNAYQSPLNTIVDNAIKEHAAEIEAACRESLDGIFTSKEFKNSIKEEFRHKVAKTLVSKLEGTVEKAVEILRQNPTLRAQMIIKIEEIISN